MPASEFQDWQAYFSIYPFTQDRQDMRTALIAERVTNAVGKLAAGMAGKRTYHPVELKKFLIDYLGDQKRAQPAKSLKQQQKEFAAFADQLRAAQGIKDAT